jgi:6-phosphogluconate dehydrogenase
MMIGGEASVVQHLDPLYRDARSRDWRDSRGPVPRQGQGGTAEQGYLHCGPNGAGHFVKMVHNGIEYGLMAAYAEAMGILRAANIGQQTHAIDCRGRRRFANPALLPI